MRLAAALGGKDEWGSFAFERRKQKKPSVVVVARLSFHPAFAPFLYL